MREHVVQLSLLENAYGFIIESLRNARRAERSHTSWAFAILHLVQGIELLLKAALEKEHPVLIYENVDNQKKTVTLEQALDRLTQIAGVQISSRERRDIQVASKVRNQIVHYKFELNSFHFRTTYQRLLEFLHFFHSKHFGEDLHTAIDPMLHKFEARILTTFKSNAVHYHGVEMGRSIPHEIQYFQRFNGIIATDGKLYRRIPQGEASSGMDETGICTDCGVLQGQYHISGCDHEQCPVCGQQFWGCEDIESYTTLTSEEFEEIGPPPGIERGAQLYKSEPGANFV